MAPFNDESIRQIKERSHGKSELTGRTDRPLHCLHFNHDKTSPHYNDITNGVRATVVEHLAHHLYYRGISQQGLGLIEPHNDYAIERLNEKAVTFMFQVGKLNSLEEELNDAILVWDHFAKRYRLLVNPKLPLIEPH